MIRENLFQLSRGRFNVELLEKAEMYHQFSRDRSYLKELHQDQNDFLRKKTKKIKNSISNIGVSFFNLSCKIENVLLIKYHY